MVHRMKFSLPRLAAGPDHPGWLLVPFLSVPALGVIASLETQGLDNILRSLSDSVLLLIPAMALAAVLACHLTARAAALAVLTVLLLDTLGLRQIIFEATRGWLHDSQNPSWVTVFLLLGTSLVSGISVAHRATLSRIVTSVMCAAQVVVLLAFHQLLVIAPIGAEEARETDLVISLVEETGTFTSLCGVAGRSCWAGAPLEVAEMVEHAVPHSEGIVRLLEDTATRHALLYSWTEMILPSTDAENLMNVSVHKTASERALVMVDTEGPAKSFTAAKMAFGSLVVAFHQAWLSLGLLIIWRHRKLRFERGQWRAGA